MDNKCSLREHQKILVELWSVFDNICRNNNIKYMLFAGSALGAVRNHGIIPWDDDLDVVLLRPEYNKFMRVASRELDKEKYFIQMEHTRHWPMFFSKLRKNGTACMERYIPKDIEMHQGIYIDIFPCDNLSRLYLQKKVQFVASKIIIAKSLYERGYATNSVVKKLVMRLCAHISTERMQNIVEHQKDNKSSFVHTFFGGAKKYKKNIYPRKWFEDIIYVPFCGKKAPVSAYYDELLTQLYGDYMTPPPVKARESKIHADIVDVNHSYTCYLDEQKNQIIDVFTRSIR